jgi:hypothetical protein
MLLLKHITKERELDKLLWIGKSQDEIDKAIDI